ncbi:MAG: HAD family hydrolase [Longimicrobiales bacterium]|nr:HAD family hydrolase [Longimicrobiales bacterium]
MSVEALFLDLDHTLFDPEAIPRSVAESVFAELREANRRMRGISEGALESSILELMGSPITLVAQKYGWPDSLRQACLEASALVVLPDVLPVYPDVAAVVQLPQRKILVTTGIPAVQLQKVQALGLRGWIAEVHIDDVMAVPRRGKRAVFEAILEQERLGPEGVVVVGDRLESEIAAGAALNLRTVHIARRGCSSGCPATHCLPDLLRLGDIL